MRPDLQHAVRAALSPLRSCWSFMLAASLAWAALGWFASPVLAPSAAPPATPWTTALTVLGALSAVATLWIDRTVITPERMAALIPVPDPALAQRHLLAGHLILWSSAELPALFGFSQLLLDGALGTHLALCALSLTILAILMPTHKRVATRLAAVLR